MRRPLFPAVLATLALAAPAQAQDEIVVLEDPDRSVATEVQQREQRLGFTAEHEYDRVIDGFAADLTPAQVKALKADPEVAMVVPNRPVRASGVVDAADSALVPPGVHRVTRTSAAQVRQRADGAVAVLDTGVDLDHPDLEVSAGKNCITPGAPPDDVNGHGTHVAGIIGARNDAAGVTGVAPGTRIVAVKVLDDQGEGSTATVLCGAEWVLANASSRGITVANFSLGGPGGASTCSSDPQHAVFCKLAGARITPVVAAGNATADFGAAATREVPAAYPQVLTVTAINDSDGRPGGAGSRCYSTNDDTAAWFSNYATSDADEAHTVAAPGVCIRSTAPGGGTESMSGTSMAAPHIAGLVALCKSEGGVAGPCASLTTPQVIARMRIADEWSVFTGRSGRRFGPLATLTDAGIPTPAPTPVDDGGAPPPPAPAQQPQPAPAQQPDPAPAPTPVVLPFPNVGAAPATPARRARPSITLVTPRLSTLRRRGLRAKLACPERCSGTIRLRVSKTTARKLGIRSTTLATARPRKAGTVTLRLSRATKQRLARVRRSFKVQIVAELELGDRAVRSAKTLTIRR